ERAEKRTEPRTPVHDRQESIAQPTSRVQSPAGGMMLQLQSALGIIALLAIAWAISEHRRNVAWRPVTIGLALTVILAFVFIKVPKVAEALAVVNRAVGAVAAATQAGTSFVFGYLGGGPLPYELKVPGAEFVLAFQALPILLVMSALTTLPFYCLV